ncbi:MAG TPA: hypothetical protein PKL77_06210 [Candidatus Omnitrophota bacterium]|nr:hypothetical protein [Candidatus Omnitrophota bacterium]
MMTEKQGKNLGGRPPTFTEDLIREICDKLEEYIENTDIPIVAKFAAMNHVCKQRLYDFAKKYDWFGDTMKKCIDKKESSLEELALYNKINVSMAIFSLKQLGWTDKSQTEITGKDGGAIKIEASFDEKMEMIRHLAGGDELPKTEDIPTSPYDDVTSPHDDID